MNTGRVFIDGLEQEHEYDGSPIVWRPTIHGFAVREGELFVIRPFGSHILEPPGGKIELGESREAALKREFLEEAGYDVEPLRLLNFGEKWLFHQREKRYYHMVMQFWEVTLGEKVQEPSDPHEFAGFLPLAKLRADQFHDVIGETVLQLQQEYV